MWTFLNRSNFLTRSSNFLTLRLKRCCFFVPSASTVVKIQTTNPPKNPNKYKWKLKWKFTSFFINSQIKKHCPLQHPSSTSTPKTIRLLPCSQSDCLFNYWKRFENRSTMMSCPPSFFFFIYSISVSLSPSNDGCFSASVASGPQSVAVGPPRAHDLMSRHAWLPTPKCKNNISPAGRAASLITVSFSILLLYLSVKNKFVFSRVHYA